MTANTSHHADNRSPTTDYRSPITDQASYLPDIDLLRALLEIPSLSGQEAAASRFLVDWMNANGFDAFVDTAGNAVGMRDGGPDKAGTPPQDIMLLGHIDTVGGQVPVRVQEGQLYGRGAVDAKGPLAAFAVAAARVQPRPGWRIVVVGAVEEEAATSKGARFVATQYRPTCCVIGEPSGASRVTLGYKGRLLCDVRVRQPVSHTAGPGLAACEVAVDYWNQVKQRAAAINRNRPRAFDQVLPSLRSFHSHSDGLSETAELLLAFRLPPDVPPEALAALLEEMAGPVELNFRGGEVAYLADKNNALVRAFLAVIRAQGERPGFVVKTGTSDMNVVGPVWQCPIVAFGPGDSSLDHTPDEHVEIAEWLQGTTVLAGVLDRIMAG